MKRILAIILVLMLALPAFAFAEERILLEINDRLARQAQTDALLIAEGEVGYPFESPLVVLNPYGNAPLSAVAIFTTEEEIGGTVTAKGIAAEDDISGRFEPAKMHFVPVLGLYSGSVTDVVITLDDGRSTTVQVETEAADVSFDDFETIMYQPDAYDYTKLNIGSIVMDRCYAGFDSKGELRWLLDDTVAEGWMFMPDGRIMLPTPYSYGVQCGWSNGICVMDGLGKVYREYIFAAGTHHDYIELPNGNYLIVADTPADVASQDYVLELDPATGEVVWELDLDDVIDRYDGGSLSRSDADWAHLNAVCYDAENDLVILSARHLDAVVAIRKETKEVVWVLGNPSGWETLDPSLLLTPVGDDFEWQYAQHNVNLLSDGSLLLLDNGTAGRVKAPEADQALDTADNYTRAVCYRIDMENMTVEQIWQYGKELGAKYYSAAMSGIEVIDEAAEEYFVTFSLCQTQYDPDHEGAPGLRTHMHLLKGGEMVWEMNYGFGGMVGTSYRTFRENIYDVMGGYDVYATAQSSGSMAEFPLLEDVQIDPAAAEAVPAGVQLDLYPFEALNVTGSFTVEGEAQLGDFACVLVNADGAQFSYDLNYYTSNTETGTLVTLDGWFSTTALEEGSYDIYLILNGAACDTLCTAQL